MTEKVEANGVVSSMSGAATAVPEDSEVGAVCTDIAARDEFDPTKHVLHEQIQAQAQRMSDVRSRFENLGADMQHIMTLLYGLQEEVKALRIGQENMTAAGKTVDDVYVRIIEVEAKLDKHQHHLERGDQANYGDDRVSGHLSYTLATICFRSPEARSILESMIATKAREVAIAEERTKKNGRSRKLQIDIA